MEKTGNPHRKKTVSATIGSVKIEGLELSQTTIDNLNDYASGKITVHEMRDNTSKTVRKLTKSSK